jgi:hypothetical protein
VNDAEFDAWRRAEEEQERGAGHDVLASYEAMREREDAQTAPPTRAGNRARGERGWLHGEHSQSLGGSDSLVNLVQFAWRRSFVLLVAAAVDLGR